MSTILRHSALSLRCRATTGTFYASLRCCNAKDVKSSLGASHRQFSDSSNEPKKGNETKKEEVDESHLNWKDRKEAPKWMQRIAPGKGGKWPPTPQEAAILVSGLGLFVWSWTA